uniref:NADH-ubiquinone oxidoreductase chain 5 n=1 Tax=Crassostrea talonata TaxID=1356040 RepID=A0A342KBC1_9BIVA|nr:NADH dehydrogenase subunit 5 [Crassostrea talonata]ANC95452.1 NADH dehydrogenase subunit 5 [Crassostrea talonata]ANC95464.1 NADH dehydrogenase subunit 5 [Crassostrea talonata]UOU85758.1 NADH dehydrogenase subunit 5 [Crassostrea talonata]
MVVLNSLMMLGLSLISGVAASCFSFGNMTFWLCWELGSVSLISLNLELFLDWMSLMFASVILLISSCVGLFMSVYMKEDGLKMFNWMVYAFILSMIVLVFSGSMPMVLVGWDWLGITSFLLVMFYEGKKSFDAAMLTALTNRIGDGLLICSAAGMMLACDLTIDMKPYCWSIVFVLGCVTKSAQVPFSSWLPAAMMAPTPVSSLVHSSTLVTAGIYLLIRSHVMWEKSSIACSFLVSAGLLTSIVAGYSAVTEPDVKKIIALSTLSQLGLMAFSLGLGEVDLAFMHLLCHAFFKAGMFLSVGALISHNVGDQYFSDFSSPTAVLSPAALLSLLVGSLSLVGIPGTAGYASKESIVAVSYSVLSLPAVVLMVGSVAFTMLYSARIIAGLTHLVKTGKFDVGSSREVFKLSVPGLLLVMFGLVGGELVVSLSISNCFFEGCSSSEAWVSPYTAIFMGFMVVLILEILSSMLKESKLKGLYSMVFVDSMSRSLSSDPGSKEFKRNKVNSENSSEFTVPKKAWKFGMGFVSGGHNFVQRSVVPVGVSSSTALSSLGVYL